MARKTDGEKIDELEKLVATLIERVDNVREETVKKDEFAKVQTRLDELKERVERTGNRGWAFLLALIAAVIGSCLTLLVQLALSTLVGRR